MYGIVRLAKAGFRPKYQQIRTANPKIRKKFLVSEPSVWFPDKVDTMSIQRTLTTLTTLTLIGPLCAFGAEAAATLPLVAAQGPLSNAMVTGMPTAIGPTDQWYRMAVLCIGVAAVSATFIHAWIRRRSRV